jgi:MYXO-CTERM domain-containing protein
MKKSSIVVCTFAALTLGRPAAAGEQVPSADPVPILGGEVVPPCGFPTAVSVGGFCTGTLVHPRVVVYAAHCGDEVPWVRLGDRIDNAPVVEVVPEHCEIHPIGEFGFGTDAAFCRFTDPIEGVPVAPPLMGCEADAALQVGEPVTVVGFGNSEDMVEPYGVKRKLDTVINALSWDEIFIGGMDEGVCYGDSGGPTYARLAGGEWRSFGITSWGQPGCGFGGYLSTIVHNIEWLEHAAEVDITPCHDGLGNWDPGPDCGGFEVDPIAVGGDWETGCDFGPLGGFESTCGDAFDPDASDVTAPTLTIVAPQPWSRVDPEDGAATAVVPVEVAIDDAGGWGVGAIELVILSGATELARIADVAAPFRFDNLSFEVGVWTLRAEAIDRAGNPGASEDLVFGVGEDPPAPPDPSGTSSEGGLDESGMPPGEVSTGDASEESSTGAPSIGEDDGCGCTSGRGGGLAGVMFVALLGARRRRRAVAIACALAGCGDSSSGDGGDTGESSGGGETTSFTATTAPTDDSTGDTGVPPDMGVAPGCGNGIVEDAEACDDGDLEDGDGCNAMCVRSGTLLQQSTWPDRAPGAAGRDLAARADGSYVAVGHRFVDGAGVSAAVLGLDSDASVSWSTLTPGAMPSDEVRPSAVAVDGAGTIFVAGLLVREDPMTMAEIVEPWIARYEPDGSPSWNLAVPAATQEEHYWDVVVDDAGDAIAVGSQRLDDDTYRMVARRHAAGDGAIAWETVDAPEDAESTALSATITPAGELLVAGWHAVTGGRDVWLGRFATDGTPIDETGFGEPLTYYYPRAVRATAGGDAIVCGGVVRASAENALIGRFTLGAAEPAVWLERIEAPGPGASGCNDLALDPDGRIAIGGFAFHPDHSYEHLFARLSGEGELLWFELVSGEEGYWYDTTEAIVLDPLGDILAVGNAQVPPNEDRLWIGRVVG